MKVLELPVNRFFFNQVKNGELDEDFRAIKPYWIKRLVKKEFMNLQPIELVHHYIKGIDIFVTYDKVVFKNGYSDSSPTTETGFLGIRFTHPEEMTCMGKGIAFAIKIDYSK